MVNDVNMDVKLEVEQFYRTLESVPYYSNKIKLLNLELVAVGAKLYEVGGIDYAKEKSGTASPHGSSVVGLIFKEEELLTQREKWITKINYCRTILNLCSEDVKSALIQKCILKKSWESIAYDLNISRPPLVRKIDHELKSIMEGANEKGTIVP